MPPTTARLGSIQNAVCNTRGRLLGAAAATTTVRRGFVRAHMRRFVCPSIETANESALARRSRAYMLDHSSMSFLSGPATSNNMCASVQHAPLERRQNDALHTPQPRQSCFLY